MVPTPPKKRPAPDQEPGAADVNKRPRHNAPASPRSIAEFELSEVLARCRALVRRSQGRAGDEIVWRDITIDLTTQTVTRDAARIALTSREWTILVQLVSRAGMPQSRARLEDGLYGWQEGIESNAIEVHISNLRKKLGAELIRTVRGIGYVVDKP